MSTATTTPPADGDPAAEAAEDDAQPDDKIGGEAARYRRRLRAAEAEAETAATAHAARVSELETAQAATSATLAAQRLAVVDLAIASARFDPEAFRPHLLTALGDDGIDGLLSDDGVLDIGKLTEAVKSTAAAFTPRHTGPRPNQQQGTPSQGGPAASWASVLGGRR